MKRLLLAATVLLSTASCDVDVAKITDTLMTSSRSDRETATRNSDFSENQVWWKREKRKNGDQRSAPVIRSDPEETFFLSRLFDKFELSPLSAAIRYLDTNGESQQDDSRKSGEEYLRYLSASPIATDRSYFTLCDSRNKCLDRREQNWQMQQPFYVEEPRWIEIDKDYVESQPLQRLKTTDPYVISRGKRIDAGFDHLKEELLRKSQNFDVFIRNRFIDKKNKRFSDLKLKNENYDKDNDDDENYEDGEEQKRQRAEKNTSQEIRIRPKKFHSINADHFVEHFSDPFCIIVVNKGMHKTNRCFPIIKPVPALIDLLRTSGQNFHSSDKMDDHRFEDGSALFERPKSKRFDSNLYSNFYLAAKEILERLIENLECDSTRCRNHFGKAIKRTKLGEGRGMLEDLLNKSDPFYVARGKRVPSPVNESMNAIYENDRNL